jgi:hypothetical protein
MTVIASRGRFEGVAKIIRFNTRFYRQPSGKSFATLNSQLP